MHIHVYERDTRAYLRTDDWQPPHPWVALPADAVAADAVPLPEPRAGFVRVLTVMADGWEYVQDHRGEAGWLADGTPHTVAELGPLPDGWSGVEPLLPLSAIITAKQAAIRDGADAALAALAVEYGAMERQTWDQQYAEAEEMRTHPDAPAPLVRAIAAARGMDAGALAARIRANRDAWVAISGHVVGKRLAYQDALDAAAALPEESAARAAIEAIVPVYTLPG